MSYSPRKADAVPQDPTTTQTTPWRRVVRHTLRHGLLLGLAYCLSEALVNLPLLLPFRYEQPLRISLAGLAFHLGAALLVSALWSPLLRRRGQAGGRISQVRISQVRRVRLHAFAVLATWIAFVAAVPYGEMDPPLVARVLPLVGTVVVFLLAALWLRRRERRERRRGSLGPTLLAAATVLLILLLHNLPRLMAESSRFELPAERAAASPALPNIVFVVLDTVRADRMGLAGYGRDTFPVLDRLAAEGVTFERALSAAPWTVPSHASMFTGLYPSTHGAHHESTYLDGGFTTLAEHLWAAGYETAIFGSNPWVSHTSGLAQGFADASWSWAESMAHNTTFAYRLASYLGRLDNDHGGGRVVRDGTRWLQRHEEGPFFVFFGFVETHIPYHKIPAERLRDFAPEKDRRTLVRSSQAIQRRILQGEAIPGPSTFEDLGDVYDAGQLYVNDLLERVLEAVAESNLERDERDTLVIIVSDHGDLLGEKGMVHHTRSLSEHLLAVPLLFHWPGELPPGRRVETPVTTAALLPTILDLAGLAVPETQTASFAPLVRGEGEVWSSPLLAEQYQDQHEVFGEYEPAHPFDRFGVRWRSYEEEGWKLVVDSEGERWLFRPREDPDELVDFAARHPEIVDNLQARLDRLVEGYGLGALDRELSAGEKAAPEIDDATKKELEALGYL